MAPEAHLGLQEVCAPGFEGLRSDPFVVRMLSLDVFLAGPWAYSKISSPAKPQSASEASSSSTASSTFADKDCTSSDRTIGDTVCCLPGCSRWSSPAEAVESKAGCLPAGRWGRALRRLQPLSTDISPELLPVAEMFAVGMGRGVFSACSLKLQTAETDPPHVSVPSRLEVAGSSEAAAQAPARPALHP